MADKAARDEAIKKASAQVPENPENSIVVADVHGWLIHTEPDLVDLVKGSPDLNQQAERILVSARAALRAFREAGGS